MLIEISEETALAIWRKDGCPSPETSAEAIRAGDVMENLDKSSLNPPWRLRWYLLGSPVFDQLPHISGRKEIEGSISSSRGNMRKLPITKGVITDIKISLEGEIP